METHAPGKFILCFVVNCCLCSWIDGKGVGNRKRNTFKELVFFHDLFLKKKKSLWPRLHTNSSEIKHRDTHTVCFFRSLGSAALWFMWKRKSVGKPLFLELCCFPLCYPYCSATGEEDNILFQRWLNALRFQFPYARNKSAQCVKSFVFEFPV